MTDLEKLVEKLIELKVMASDAFKANNFPERELSADERAAAQVAEDITAGFYRAALAAYIDRAVASVGL